MPFAPGVLERPALEVAPLLLGAVLTRGAVSVRITEVEAYLGRIDPGSHAFRGRTPRTATMFGPAGYLYAYFSYGMHVCANVVCSPEGEASALLLRGGEVIAGIDEARIRRPTSKTDADLARGPARLTKALGIVLGDDGADLGRSQTTSWVVRAPLMLKRM
ncbi:DNA-3-methyladenine glycosylase [Cryobacterium glaciale]|uniref:Putative 3-methyladenine DNA glycosylase n=1 Tax=Cryobacterium glaciale TaxID=1259145 RepID=A0A4R8UUJ7_9MICO|nr:DNA-3-methyladenine glycosylase [Cryobacterium glaciale]TFB72525.1 DNA-3-methyladenine glycosylase [Cryobacterium glaciale]